MDMVVERVRVMSAISDIPIACSYQANQRLVLGTKIYPPCSKSNETSRDLFRNQSVSTKRGTILQRKLTLISGAAGVVFVEFCLARNLQVDLRRSKLAID
jgi:hypothetical protein